MDEPASMNLTTSPPLPAPTTTRALRARVATARNTGRARSQASTAGSGSRSSDSRHGSASTSRGASASASGSRAGSAAATSRGGSVLDAWTDALVGAAAIPDLEGGFEVVEKTGKKSGTEILDDDEIQELSGASVPGASARALGKRKQEDMEFGDDIEEISITSEEGERYGKRTKLLHKSEEDVTVVDRTQTSDVSVPLDEATSGVLLSGFPSESSAGGLLMSSEHTVNLSADRTARTAWSSDTPWPSCRDDRNSEAPSASSSSLEQQLSSTLSQASVDGLHDTGLSATSQPVSIDLVEADFPNPVLDPSSSFVSVHASNKPAAAASEALSPTLHDITTITVITPATSPSLHVSKSLPPPTSPTAPVPPSLPETHSLPTSPPPQVPDPEPLHTYACPICFSPPSNATLTPCGHILCGECLFTAVNAAVMRTGVGGLGARCPVCRASLPGWDGRGGGVIGLKARVMISL